MATMLKECAESFNSEERNDFIEVQCNWEIKTDKRIRDTVSTICAVQAPERLSVDDVVSLESCVALFSNSDEANPCVIDIKVTNNQKIKRIAVVSEATILEFFKQYGEYSSTQYAEFIDEFEDQSVYIGETTIDIPTSEASIKFTKRKRKNPEMWLYGIKLILTDAKEEKNGGMFNFDVINGFLTNTDKTLTAQKFFNSLSLNDKDLNLPTFEKCIGQLMLNSEPDSIKQEKKSENDSERLEFKEYIDSKLDEIEKRLIIKIESMEKRMNNKLDHILSLLQK